jgi:hypothetical protein
MIRRRQLGVSSDPTFSTWALQRPPPSIHGGAAAPAAEHPRDEPATDREGEVANDIAPSRVYPDGWIVGAGRVRHEDEPVAGVQAVHDIHAATEYGAVDRAMELVQRGRRGERRQGTLRRWITWAKWRRWRRWSSGRVGGLFVRAGKSVTHWDFASSVS